MAWTAMIHNPKTDTDIDITARIMDVQASEVLGGESNTFTVSCRLIQETHKFHHMYVYKDGVLRFAGFIVNQTDADVGYKKTSFACIDWTYILANRVVAAAYLSDDAFLGRPDLIIRDMLTQKCPEITQNNIDEVSYTIEAESFPYVTALDAVSKIADYVPDWRWYIDADKDFHFFNKYESDGVAFGRVGGQYNFLRNSLTVKHIGENQVNRVWIIGAKQASPNFIEVFYQGNGTQRIFGPLPYEPNFTDVYVDGVLKSSKLESNDDGAQDFLINKAQRLIMIPDNIATPFTGVIKVRFRPSIQVIDYFENPTSVEEYGLYEKAVKNKDITDKLSARQFGRALIKRVSAERRLVSLRTLEDVKIGQKCTITIDEDSPTHGKWDVSGSFLVTSVSTSVTLQEEHTQETRSVELEEII